LEIIMPSFAMGKELAGLGGLFNRFVAAPLTGAALFNQGRSGSALNQGLQSIPSTRKTDAGRALGNVLGNEMRYMGSQLQRGSLPYLGNEMRYATNELSQRRNPYGRPLNAIDTGKYGPTDWNPSANPLRVPSAPVLPPPTDGAAQRNYEAEKSRATQLATQDQLSKKYQVADLTKAYNTAATPEEKEKIGLQIWATTNPELAQKLKPGQTGYSEAISAFQSQSPLGAITKAAGGMQYADLSQKPITTPVGPGGVPFGFSPAQLQTPLTGIEIPPTDKIGVKEFFSDTKPAPGAMEAFTDQMRLFSPEKLDETKRALLIQAFNKGLK
jgi:hypothetical protein